MLVFDLVVASGQTLINFAPDGSSDYLMLASALTGLALVPITMTRLGEPNPGELRVLSVRRLYEASRIGLAGAGVAGILVGSFYAPGVVFARQIGLSVLKWPCS